MNKIILISIFCSFFFLTSVNAQKYKGQRFKVGAVAALNSAQVDGDKIFGYRKLGVQAGIQGIAMLNKKQYLSMEFMISQRGAVTSTDDVGSRRSAYMTIRSNYVEVPFLYHRALNLSDDKPWGTELYTGLSVGRLLGANIEGVVGGSNPNPIMFLKDRTVELENFEIAYIIGGTFFFNENFGVTLRHTVGLTTFFEPTEIEIGAGLKPLRNLFVTVGGVYILN